MIRRLDWLRADRAATDETGWAENLAIFRIAYLGIAVVPVLLDLWGWTRTALPGLPAELWRPISFYRYVPMRALLSAPLAEALTVLALALVALAMVGFRPRLTLTLGTVATLYVLGLPQNQGKIHHYHNVIWFMALLAAGPSGHALSVDSWLRRRAGRPPPPRGALLTLAYVWVLMGVLYLAPGLGKLGAALTGDWATADHQRRLLWNKWMQLAWYGPPPFSLLRTDGLPDLALTAGALAVIAFEIGFIVLVLVRRTRPLAAAIGLSFHLGTALAMGIFFAWLTPAYVALIDWAGLRGRRPRRAPAPAPAAMPARRAGLSPVHVVGGVLVAGEILVAALHLVTASQPWPMSPPRVALQLLGSWRRQHFEWPFAAYPLFTTDAAPTVETWELRVQMTDGRETTVGPAAFQAAIGRPSSSQNVCRNVARERDPARREAMSAALIRALWPHVPAETRLGARSARAYLASWQVGPRPEAPLRRELLLEVPAARLDAPDGRKAN